MHMAIENSKYVFVKNLYIEAPGDSPNTDGIHIQHSRKISITSSSIRTGNTLFLFLSIYTLSYALMFSPSNDPNILIRLNTIYFGT